MSTGFLFPLFLFFFSFKKIKTSKTSSLLDCGLRLKIVNLTSVDNIKFNSCRKVYISINILKLIIIKLVIILYASKV